jgi:hypothetical protein
MRLIPVMDLLTAGICGPSDCHLWLSQNFCAGWPVGTGHQPAARRSSVVIVVAGHAFRCPPPSLHAPYNEGDQENDWDSDSHYDCGVAAEVPAKQQNQPERRANQLAKLRDALPASRLV